jgi:MoxR-like ATPase
MTGGSMAERAFFNPRPVEKQTRAAGEPARDGDVYVYHDDDVVLAVNVALATQRPLLLNGPSGSGKSALARNVARTLNRRYYEHVVTARTEPRDLLYRFDSVRRLGDAQSASAELPPIASYVEPGVLWWALDPDSAQNRGSQPLDAKYRATDPSALDSQDAVVLIDEIDKADPDVPNGLLVPLGAYRFRVENTNTDVLGRRNALIFITNNGERELPATFIRRCVSLEMKSPDEQQLVAIARALIPGEEWNETLAAEIARRLVKLGRDQSAAAGQRWSTGEYLDAIRACNKLAIDERSASFKKLLQITLEKTAHPGDASE